MNTPRTLFILAALLASLTCRPCPAADSWITVEGLTHTVIDDHDVVCVDLDRSFLPKAHVLTHRIPFRTYFDIKPVKAYSGPKRLEPDSKLIDAIRTGYHPDGRFLRVVIDFRLDVPLDFTWAYSKKSHRTCLQIHERREGEQE